MTPKEKAGELLLKCYGLNQPTTFDTKAAMRQAINVVNEIMYNMGTTIPFMAESSELLGSPDWWLRVMSELTKMQVNEKGNPIQ